MRLVGSTSPVGHLLQTLTGIKRLDEKAAAIGGDRVVLDSAGFIRGEVAREFQWQTIDLLRPDHVVAIQRDRELEPVLRPFDRRPRPVVHRLTASDAAETRDFDRRREYRTRRFREALAGGRAHPLSLADHPFHGRVPAGRRPEQWVGRLIAMCDGEGFVSGLGIVEGVDAEAELLRVLSTLPEGVTPVSIQVGSTRVNRRGEEL